MSYWFCSEFYMLSVVQKFWKSVKIWQSYRELLGGPFLRHSVEPEVLTIEVLHRADRVFKKGFSAFLLQWPWPWLDDLHIETWPTKTTRWSLPSNRWPVCQYAFARKVVCHLDVWMHDLQNSQCFWPYIGLVLRLTRLHSAASDLEAVFYLVKVHTVSCSKFKLFYRHIKYTNANMSHMQTCC